MNRYDEFLKYFLPEYLKNPLIKEIIICDENGLDAKKINEDIALIDPLPKIRLFVNEERLGPFHNKLNAVRRATSEWVALIDSDNFADEDYFKEAASFIVKRRPSPHSILAPSAANPGKNMAEYATHAGFNFRAFTGFNVNIDYFKTMTEDKFRRHNQLLLLFNTGNFVLHKSLVHSLRLEAEDPKKKTDFFDVLYFNTLLFEQIHGLNFYVIPTMSYKHSIHNGSITMQSEAEGRQLLEMFKPRFFALRQR
jgi:glycosyltransferase involved in cell wall biosynthesis